MKGKSKIRIWILVVFLVVIAFVGGLFWLRSKGNYDKNSPGEKLKRLLEQPEIKQTLLSHKRWDKEKLEWVKPDSEKTELTVYYMGNFFVENSPETFATFECFNSQKWIRIAVDTKNPLLQGKELKHGARLKFKIIFFGKDVQKHWAAGRKVTGGYWADYYYFHANNTSFQLQPLPYQWENTEPLNPSFLGKWKINLPKSIESGFAKINAKIRRRIDEQLSRDCYYYAVKNGDRSLEIEIEEENGLVQILGGYAVFWIKNLDDYSMICFTDYHPNHSFDILENAAVPTIFQLDKNKKNLTVFHPDIVRDVCRSVGVEGRSILGWIPFTRNWEYDRLESYFSKHAQIIATKIE